MKKIEKKQLIVIIVSIIIGIVGVTVINLNSLLIKIAFTESQPTQEEYDILKEYTLDVAKGEKFNNIEDIDINKKVEEEMLKIKVEIPNKYGVEAEFPLSKMKNFEIENGVIEYKAIVEYDKAMYSEYSIIKNKISIIFMDLLLIPIIAIIPYVIFYWGPREWKKIKEKINND